MKKNIVWIVLIIVGLLGLIFFLGTDEVANPQTTAKDWIINNSPTYIFDGSNLTFLTIKNENFYFSFESSHGGYGNRTEELVTQAITPHIIEITIENNKVVSAIADGRYNEIKKELIISVPETEIINIFFLDAMSEQEELVRIEKEVSVASPQVAIEKLLEGPSAKEAENGIFSMINPGTVLYDLTIKDGVATIDFNQKLQENIAGSAKVTTIRKQIEETLLQFEEIESVIISIDGNTEEILQP